MFALSTSPRRDSNPGPAATHHFFSFFTVAVDPESSGRNLLVPVDAGDIVLEFFHHPLADETLQRLGPEHLLLGELPLA